MKGGKIVKSRSLCEIFFRNCYERVSHNEEEFGVSIFFVW